MCPGCWQQALCPSALPAWGPRVHLALTASRALTLPAGSSVIHQHCQCLQLSLGGLLAFLPTPLRGEEPLLYQLSVPLLGYPGD